MTSLTRATDTNHRTPRVALAALTLAAALSGCLEVGGADVVIDLDHRTITVDLIDLHDVYFGGFLNDSRSELLADLPRVVRTAEEYEPRPGQLDLRLEGRFDVPADAGLTQASPTGPYRFCPTRGLVIITANAAASDADGCVLFPRTTRVARVTLARPTPFTHESILDGFLAWDEKGRPAPQ